MELPVDAPYDLSDRRDVLFVVISRDVDVPPVWAQGGGGGRCGD